MSQTTMLQYEAPCQWLTHSLLLSVYSILGPVHCMDWYKTPAPGQQGHPKTAFRIGLASLIDNYHNYIAVIGLRDEYVLVEDNFTDYPDFVGLAEAYHGYPATSLQWQPTTAANHPWSQKSANTELIATTSDALRVWEYSSDVPVDVSSYVGRPPPDSGHHSLIMKTALSGVCSVLVDTLSHTFTTSYSNQRFRINQLGRHWPISHGMRNRLVSLSHPRLTPRVPFGILTLPPPSHSS